MNRIRSLDLRFISDELERSYNASHEHELLRQARLGSLLAGGTALAHGACIGWQVFGHAIFADTVQRKVILYQQLMWSVTCALLVSLYTLRLCCGLFRRWNWEVIVMLMMVYAACAVIMGQRFSLTKLMGEDPYLIWDDENLIGSEAWGWVCLQTIITATTFFLPVRCIFSWIVPVVGVLFYICAHPFDGIETIFRTGILLGLSYLSWSASWKVEKHMRIEWAAVRQAVKSSRQAEEIDEKEQEIKAKDDLAKSLLMVSRAFCDTMVHLDSEFQILSTEDTFFQESMSGRPFTDLLAQDDVARFLSCAHRARVSRLPELLPITLHRRLSISEVQVFLVARASNSEPGRYILGIRVDRDRGSSFQYQDSPGPSRKTSLVIPPKKELLSTGLVLPMNVPTYRSEDSILSTGLVMPPGVLTDRSDDSLLSTGLVMPPNALEGRLSYDSDGMQAYRLVPPPPGVILDMWPSQEDVPPESNELPSRPQQHRASMSSESTEPPSRPQQHASMTSYTFNVRSSLLTVCSEAAGALAATPPAGSTGGDSPRSPRSRQGSGCGQVTHSGSTDRGGGPMTHSGPTWRVSRRKSEPAASQQVRSDTECRRDSRESTLSRSAPSCYEAIHEDSESSFLDVLPGAGSATSPRVTPTKARAVAVRLLLKRWYVAKDNQTCCQFHAAVESIADARAYLRQEPCEPTWSSYEEQCVRCLCMNHSNKCCVCGLGFAVDIA